MHCRLTQAICICGDSEIVHYLRSVRAVPFFRQKSSRKPANAVSPVRYVQQQKMKKEKETE